MRSIRSQLIRLLDGVLKYCPKCKTDMPFKKSLWDSAWVCQKCGYRMK
jgi:DNA-directed RNA polymerase subunit M/transcription elongation factor TFIIS